MGFVVSVGRIVLCIVQRFKVSPSNSLDTFKCFIRSLRVALRRIKEEQFNITLNEGHGCHVHLTLHISSADTVGVELHIDTLDH